MAAIACACQLVSLPHRVSESAPREFATFDRASRLCGRRRGAVAGALGAQLRPKRGRSASRGLPRAARRPGAPPRPLRRRPARSAANVAAPKSTEPWSRGGSRCHPAARRWSGFRRYLDVPLPPSRSGLVGERAVGEDGEQPFPRVPLCFFPLPGHTVTTTEISGRQLQ